RIDGELAEGVVQGIAVDVIGRVVDARIDQGGGLVAVVVKVIMQRLEERIPQVVLVIVIQGIGCARAGGFGGSCSGGCGGVAGLDAIDGAMGGFLLRRCAAAAEHVLAGGLAGVGHAGAALLGGLGGGLGGGLVVI